jgi:polysaccharide export outer membrane protein
MNISFFRVKAILTPVAIASILSVFFCSCGDTRRLTYMQGKFDTARLSQVRLNDPVIQKGDMLSIVVYSDNPQATALYNQSVAVLPGAASGNTGNGTPSEGLTQNLSSNPPVSGGYLVDAQGDIQFQGLGRLHIAGYTRALLKDTLSLLLKDYLKNPYFNIRFLNYRVTILGELGKPGVYTIPGEHLNILEALGLAGDITIYGRRDNVMIIREENGKRSFGRLDLTKPEIMESSYFYLQQNDVVVVEPNKTKAASSDVTGRNITIAATVVTALAVVVNLLRK